MKYYRQIEPNLNAIISQTEGKMVSDKVFDEKCQAWFPNYILNTYEGAQFNVMGVLQILNEATDSGPIFFLCTEVDLDDLKTKSIFNVGSVFFVGPSGRIYDDKLEKAILIRFEILRGQFIQKYQLYPGYPMFLTEEQSEFLNSLKS